MSLLSTQTSRYSKCLVAWIGARAFNLSPFSKENCENATFHPGFFCLRTSLLMWLWSNDTDEACATAHGWWFLLGHEQADQHHESEDLRHLQGQHFKGRTWHILGRSSKHSENSPTAQDMKHWGHDRVSDHSFMLMSSCLDRSQEFRLPVRVS